MSPYVILGLAVGIPLVLAIVLRVHVAWLLFSIASGVALQQALAPSASLAISGLTQSLPADQIANATLLLAPILLGCLLFKRTIVHSNVVLQILPLILTCLYAATVLIPLLSPAAQNSLYSTQIGQQLKQADGVIAAAATLLTILVAWRTYRVPAADSRGGH